MKIFKLGILFALITILKAKPVNTEENGEKIATINMRSLVPVIERIEKGMSAISERLNSQNSKKDPALAERFSLFSKPKLENIDNVRQQRSYYKLSYLLETLSKSVIDAIVDIIKLNNGHLKLIFINFWVYVGLLVGSCPGFIMYIGYQSVQILLYFIYSRLNIFRSISRYIINIFQRKFPTIVQYIKTLIVQTCSRGLARIKNIFRRGYGFQHVK